MTCPWARRCRPRSRGSTTRATPTRSRRPRSSRPRSQDATTTTKGGPRARPTASRPVDATAMTIDLTPVPRRPCPEIVVERLRGARRVLAVGHENPDADTLGATLGVVAIVEALGGRADPVCTDPPPPLYDFVDGHRALPDGPGSGRRRTTCSSSPTAARSTGSARSASGTPSCSSGCPRVVIDHHASNAVGRRGRLDRAGVGGDVRDGRPPRRPPRPRLRRGRSGRGWPRP